MADTSVLRQFLILLYKGALLRRRHYIITFFEIIIPVFVASIFPMIESETRSKYPEIYDMMDKRSGNWENFTTYDPFLVFERNNYIPRNVYFVFTPNNSITADFMEKSVDRFKENLYSDDRNYKIIPTENEDRLEKHCLNVYSGNSKPLVIGTVFSNFHSAKSEIPPSLDYKIRYAGYSFQTSRKYRFGGPNYNTDYTASNFLHWQASVEETFIELKMNNSGTKMDYKVSMQRFPYPTHKKSGFFDMVEYAPMLIIYGYFIFIINLLRRVIEEKSNGSKELMKMMGMTDAVYWTSTFLNYFIVGLLTTFLITVIYKCPLKTGFIFLDKTDFFLLLLLLVVYIASIILFCMAISIFFNRAVFGIIVMVMIWIVSYSILSNIFFGFNLEKNYFDLATIAKLAICLLPTGSLPTMFSIIGYHKKIKEGVTWMNMTEFSISPDMNMLIVLIMMLFSCFFYILIIWYFDKVWPWQPGVPQPFYFPFTKNYWCGPNRKGNNDLELSSAKNSNQEFFEEEPRGIVAGVEIHNLSKAFQDGFQSKVAVNNLSLNIFQGQITALLGHNGAGKTTTINILTGLYSPSSGTASINGMDILTNTSRARRGLGVCPQHNVLFDTLTVLEHLKIFGGLKGIPWRDLENEAQKVLEILKLTEKKNELVKTLSGGMKRKLSLANAIVGGSKVLFLDEPTSGLDVEARRSVWDALLDIRHDRTIILTTHYMEEADVLGDRIAIMAKGEIQCCGTSIFLKKKFGKN